MQPRTFDNYRTIISKIEVVNKIKFIVNKVLASTKYYLVSQFLINIFYAPKIAIFAEIFLNNFILNWIF